MPDGLVIPGGPGFSGHPQPPDVPCDPTGDAWRGEPGPPGPPGPPGSFGGGEAPVDGFAYGRVNAVWQKVVPITQLGYAIGQVPGPIVSQGGISALRPPAELIFQRNAFAATDGSDFRFRRATTFTGGTPSNINKTLQVEFGNTAGNGCQEWPFLVKAMNSSTSGGQLVSAYIQAWRNAGTGLTTGLITDVADFQGTASSVSGQLTSMEWDLNATGADDMANGGRFGGIGGRQMIHAVFANMSTTINSQYTAGIWFGTGINGSASAYVDSLLCVQGGVGQPTLIRNFLDSRGAAPPPGVTDPVAAVRMSAGHVVDFNGGPALNSAPGNYLQYTTTGTPRLRYMDAAIERFAISDNGGISNPSLPVNVLYYGAALDGTTNDTAAWAAARAAAIDNGTIWVPRGRQFVNTAPTGGPTTPVLWKYDGNYVGSSGTSPVVGMGTDTVESFVAGSKYFSRSNTATGFLAPIVRIDSTVNHTGGVAHNTVTALRINASATSSALEDTLGVAAVITSTKPSGGNLVAVTGYATVSASGRNHAAFGGNISATDNTGLKSSASGISSIGAELDVLANDDDDGGGGSPNFGIPAGIGQRVVLDVVGAKASTAGTDVVVGWGIRVGPTGGTTGITFRRSYAAYGPFSSAAFSTEFGVQGTGANAIWLGDGHRIAFDKAGTRTLSYDSASGKLFIAVSGVNRLSIDASGNVRAAGTITGSVTP